MKKVTVIGKFITGALAADGQSIKTRIITNELEKALGAEQVQRLDTYGWKKAPLKLFLRTFSAVRNSANVVFMTDAGGIKVFPWLLLLANPFGKCALHYVVVGGWLIGYLQKHRFIAGCLKRFQWIFVETETMQAGMEALGFQNVYRMPNFKELPLLSEADLVRCAEPYKFCTFSRVMEEKGIAEAVNAVAEVNRRYGRTVCKLDIYGQTDPAQTEWFDRLRNRFSPEIRYCGTVPYGQSTDVVKEYHALLFPTKFYTEGIPGTVIDAYAAGVPVVASRWESFDDVIVHEKTGIGYPFDQPEALTQILTELIADPARIYNMKKNCLREAEKYTPEKGLTILLSRLA